MAKSDDEILEEIHQLDARRVIVIDQAVRFVDSEAAHIQAFTKLMLSKVEKNALACLQTCSREVRPVRPSLNIRESRAEEILVPPEKNLSSAKIDQRANDIPRGPSLPEFRILPVPLQLPEAIVCVRVN